MAREDTQFKPGQVANPAGRPSFRDLIEKVGAEIVDVELEDGTKVKMSRSEKAVRAQFLMAERASMVATPAFKALANHLEGSKVHQDNTSSDGSMKPQVTVYIPSNGRETSQESVG